MAQETLTISGSYSSVPPSFPPSAAQETSSPINEVSYLQHKSADTLSLTVDGPVAIPFAGLTVCNVIIISCTGKVRVRITSADGAQQAIPVDGFLIWKSGSVPVTAIDLTRVTGIETDVTYYIGENQ